MPPKKDCKEPIKVTQDKDSAEEAGRKLDVQLAEKLRDASVKFLEESKETSDAGNEELESMAQKILKDFPNHLPVLVWQLKRAESALSKVH